MGKIRKTIKNVAMSVIPVNTSGFPQWKKTTCKPQVSVRNTMETTDKPNILKTSGKQKVSTLKL